MQRRQASSFLLSGFFPRWIALSLHRIRNAVRGRASRTSQPSSNLPLQRASARRIFGLQVRYANSFTSYLIRYPREGTICLAHDERRYYSGRGRFLMPNEIEVLVQEALQRENLFVVPLVTVNIVEHHSRPITVTVLFESRQCSRQSVASLSYASARAGGLVPDLAGRNSRHPSRSGYQRSIDAAHTGQSAHQRRRPRTEPKLNGGEEIRVPDVGKIIVAGNSVVRPMPLSGSSISSANTVTTAIAQAQATIPLRFPHRVY